MKKGKDQVVFNILAYVLVGLFAILCLVPFYLIVVGSFTSESTIVKEGNRSVSSGTEKSTKYSARIWCDHFCNGCGNTAFDLYDNDDRLCVVTSGFSVEKWHFFFLFLHDII